MSEFTTDHDLKAYEDMATEKVVNNYKDKYPLNTFKGKTKEELIDLIEMIRSADCEKLINMVDRERFIGDGKNRAINRIRDYYNK